MTDLKTNPMRLKRHAAGLTQRQLADKLDVTHQLISSWESGNSWPGPTLIPRLAEVFNMAPEAFARELEKARRELQPA